MGAAYSVKLRLSYQDPESIIFATQSFVDNTSSANFSNVDYSSIVSAIQIILPKRGFRLEEQLDNYIACSCNFDASYSWESIIYAWFESIASVLDDGSRIWVFPDEGFVEGIVSSGKVRWSEEESDDEIDDEEVNTDSGMKVSDPELQKAIDYINEFTEDEYGDITIKEGTDLSDVGILFSYAGDDDEYMVEVKVDLNNFTINYYIDQELCDQDKYTSLSELNDTLSRLSFDWLYSTCCDCIEWDEE